MIPLFSALSDSPLAADGKRFGPRLIAWLPPLLTIASLAVSIYIAGKQIEASRDIQNINSRLTSNQMAMSRSQFSASLAASLMDPLIKGTESERLIAMIILESAADSLATSIFAGLALQDQNVNVRLQAIRALGRKGVGATAREALTAVQKSAKTGSEKKTAAQAEKELSFREKLRLARVMYGQELWQSAVQYYKEALELADTTAVDLPKSVLAKSYDTHGDPKNAAITFDAAFKE